MRLRVVLMVLLAMVLVTAVPASAATPHTSSNHTNNGCTWRGHHSYDESGSNSYAYATASKVSGNCVEVSVRMSYNGSATGYDFHPTFASLDHDGFSLDFNWSDHNADPLGPPQYVGFRMF